MKSINAWLFQIDSQEYALPFAAHSGVQLPEAAGVGFVQAFENAVAAFIHVPV